MLALGRNRGVTKQQKVPTAGPSGVEGSAFWAILRTSFPWRNLLVFFILFSLCEKNVDYWRLFGIFWNFFGIFLEFFGIFPFLYDFALYFSL
jgi:hypothetical protein